jgi:aminoglycoside phosphotransferase (APT) family kinase protein
MYVPADAILKSIRTELAPLLGADNTEASTSQGITAALGILFAREAGGAALLQDRLRALETIVAKLAGNDLSYRPLLTEIRSVRSQNAQSTLEEVWNSLIRQFEALAAQHVNAPGAKGNKELALALCAWEVADRNRVITPHYGDSEAVDTSLTAPRFEAYLQERFSEPGLRVQNFRQISGGFGKETFILEVQGKALEGDIVIRRDPLVGTVDNDCHYVRVEYPVIRAAYARGFPAPDAIWVDTEHKLLPGGDFMVMRRAAGVTGGNVFGATTALSEDLVEVLASSVARLHTLPPLLELGDLTESIRSDSWSMSMADNMHRYVRNWFDIYLSEVHNPSPALVSLFGWMLDNVPAAPAPGAMLHGDIGFHNMLIDNGKLTALVDWEFAHVGDPAEDLGAVRNTARYPWEMFMRHYQAAGGPAIDPERLHYYRIWQHVRNAAASNVCMGRFARRQLSDLKLVYTGHYHFPLFIKAASDLLAAGPDGDAGHVAY